MTIIFFGSDPWFSPPVLEAILKAKHQVALIVTKGDAFKNFRFKISPAFACHSPSGTIRSRFMARFSAGRDLRFIEAKTSEDISIKKMATMVEMAKMAKNGCSDYSSPNHYSHSNHSSHSFIPDAIVLASFGPPFLSDELLKWPTYGCFNVHAALLPRWRGASPVFAALAAGDRETGVSIVRMTEKIDRGPVLGQKRIHIHQPTIAENSSIVFSTRATRGTCDICATSHFDTRESLTRRLGLLGGELLVETLKKLENDQINEISQSEKSPTPYTRRLTKDSGRIDWQKSPDEIERFIRAVTPWPGAFTSVKFNPPVGGQSSKWQIIPELKILKAHLDVFPIPNSQRHNQQPITNNQQLISDLVQLPGKNPIIWKQFLAGHPNANLV